MPSHPSTLSPPSIAKPHRRGDGGDRVRLPWLRFAALVLTLTLVAGFVPVFGHQGDPKAYDRLPPYVGPGYRGGVAYAGGPPTVFDSAGVTLMSWLPLSDFGTPANGNDCWGYVSPSGREYALFGHSNGVSIVEVTSPGNPVIVDTVGGVVSLWRDVKVYDHYAYAVTEGNGGGIQVIDLADVDNGIVTVVATVTTGGTTKTHNVFVDEVNGYLYRIGGGSNGLRIFDLADPALPVFVASWPDRYVHDAQVVTYDTGPYAGKQIAFCCSGFNGGWVEPGVDILDVTDKANIILMSRYIYPDGHYSHQAWVSPDKQYLYLDDELDESDLSGSPGAITTTTRVLDITDLGNPSVLDTFTSGSTAIDHNLYVKDNLIFEANYRSGLRVFDASDPVAPVEIAYFDTFPADDQPNFNGLWSSYPFFPSGTIIGSDLERGLFVWYLGDLPLAGDFPFGQPSTVSASGGTTITVQLVEQAGATLAPGSVELHADAGTGFTAIPMTEVGTLQFEAELPLAPCGSVISWYVSASSTDGFELTLPWGAPSEFYTSVVAASALASPDDFDLDLGWTAGAPGDDATTGIWVRVDPIGTSAQPEDDHSIDGTMCWVTGNGTVGGGLGEADVDTGKTTLLSPVFDITGASDALVEYWRWYSNDQGPSIDDVFQVDAIGAPGSAWTAVETLGPGDPESSGGWYRHRFLLSEVMPVGGEFQLRFIASDYAPGSLVEAALDDFTVTTLFCDDCDGDGIDDLLAILDGLVPDCNGNGIPDSCDIASGASLDLDLDGIPDECGCIPFIRGDANADGLVELSDGIYILDWLFDGGPDPTPPTSSDVDADGSDNLADVIYLLNYLFIGGAPPPPPFPTAGCP